VRAQFIAQRLLWLLVSLIGISIITFVISHVIPADPIRVAAGPNARQEQVETLRREFGMDRPLPEQYLRYLAGLFQGNLGRSIRTRRPVLDDIKQYFPATLELTITAMLIVILVGIPVGVLSAVHRNGIIDHATRLIALSGVSVPIFWLALLMQLLFYAKLGLLPADGRIGLLINPPRQISGLYLLDSLLSLNGTAFWSSLTHLVLPAMTLAFGSLAVLTRMVRSSMLDVLNEDYMRTARSKGLPQHLVIYRHGLRNALIPATTTMALQAGALLGGVFLVEVVFSWPGIGFYAMKSLTSLDFPAIMGVTLLVTVIYALANLIADIAYCFLDPRISYESRG
jgi:peptide/nickel transport system permease protein